MNTLDVTVTKVHIPPYKNTTGDNCCWEVVVEGDCWGEKKLYTLHRTSKEAIDRIKEGYTWSC